MSNFAGLAFHSLPSPQQDNSCDCGVYVLLATNVLVQRLLMAPDKSLKQGSNPWSLENISFNADAGRLEMQRLIADLIGRRGKKIGTKVDIEITPSASLNPEKGGQVKKSRR